VRVTYARMDVPGRRRSTLSMNALSLMARVSAWAQPARGKGRVAAAPPMAQAMAAMLDSERAAT
jgi:hypothetical protein